MSESSPAHASNGPLIRSLLALAKQAKGRGNTQRESAIRSAVSSLLLFPLPLRTSSQAKELKHVGKQAAGIIEGVLAAQQRKRERDESRADDYDSDFDEEQEDEEEVQEEEDEAAFEQPSEERPARKESKRSNKKSELSPSSSASSASSTSSRSASSSAKPKGKAEQKAEPRRGGAEGAKGRAKRGRAEAAESPSASPSRPLPALSSSAAHWDVVLLVDVRERRRQPLFPQLNSLFAKSSSSALLCESRELSLGDFAWIARHKEFPSVEVVLDCLVERKRLSDFAHSIRDGRFSEQKRRLRGCGLAGLCFLLEGYWPWAEEEREEEREERQDQRRDQAKQRGQRERLWAKSRLAVPLPTLFSAAVSLLVEHRFHVLESPTTEESLKRLKELHQLLQRRYELEGIPWGADRRGEGELYASFSQRMRKSLQPVLQGEELRGEGEGPQEGPQETQQKQQKQQKQQDQQHQQQQQEQQEADLLSLPRTRQFGLQLRQINGLSPSAVVALLRRFPSARQLLDAYEQCGDAQEEELLLADLLVSQSSKRRLGKAVSARVRSFFRAESYS